MKFLDYMRDPTISRSMKFSYAVLKLYPLWFFLFIVWMCYWGYTGWVNAR